MICKENNSVGRVRFERNRIREAPLWRKWGHFLCSPKQVLPWLCFCSIKHPCCYWRCHILYTLEKKTCSIQESYTKKSAFPWFAFFENQKLLLLSNLCSFTLSFLVVINELLQNIKFMLFKWWMQSLCSSCVYFLCIHTLSCLFIYHFTNTSNECV